jgi:hypothetical protein
MDRPRGDYQIDCQGDQPADRQAEGLPIAEAARWLGVSENAVRQRIKRGTVDACKVDGIWHVQVATAGVEHRPSGDHEPAGRSDHQGDHHTGHQDRPSGDHQGDRPVGAVSMAARAQLGAIVEEMIAPLVAAHEERTAALARDLGRAEAERDEATQVRAIAEAERDALRITLDRVMAERSVTEPLSASPEAPESPAPAESGGGLLGRLRRLLGG